MGTILYCIFYWYKNTIFDQKIKKCLIVRQQLELVNHVFSVMTILTSLCVIEYESMLNTQFLITGSFAVGDYERAMNINSLYLFIGTILYSNRMIIYLKFHLCCNDVYKSWIFLYFLDITMLYIANNLLNSYFVHFSINNIILKFYQQLCFCDPE